MLSSFNAAQIDFFPNVVRLIHVDGIKLLPIYFTLVGISPDASLTAFTHRRLFRSMAHTISFRWIVYTKSKLKYTVGAQ